MTQAATPPAAPHRLYIQKSVEITSRLLDTSPTFTTFGPLGHIRLPLFFISDLTSDIASSGNLSRLAIFRHAQE